jgi:hypothetical protein
VAQLCVAALDKGWAIAGEPRLDLSHACSPECINIYGLVSIITRMRDKDVRIRNHGNIGS